MASRHKNLASLLLRALGLMSRLSQLGAARRLLTQPTLVSVSCARPLPLLLPASEWFEARYNPSQRLEQRAADRARKPAAATALAAAVVAAAAKSQERGAAARAVGRRRATSDSQRRVPPPPSLLLLFFFSFTAPDTTTPPPPLLPLPAQAVCRTRPLTELSAPFVLWCPWLRRPLFIFFRQEGREGPPMPGADHGRALAGAPSAVPLAAAVSLSCARADRTSGDLETPPPLQGVPGLHDAGGRLVTLRRVPPWLPRAALAAALEGAAREGRPTPDGADDDGEEEDPDEGPPVVRLANNLSPCLTPGAARGASRPPASPGLALGDAWARHSRLHKKQPRDPKLLATSAASP